MGLGRIGVRGKTVVVHKIEGQAWLKIKIRISIEKTYENYIKSIDFI